VVDEAGTRRMTRYRVARLADTDLDRIWLYIASDNVSAADRQLANLHKKFETLAIHPDLGESRPELASGGYRVFAAGSYVIFCRKIDDGIEIARVIHGSRDIDAVF